MGQQTYYRWQAQQVNSPQRPAIEKELEAVERRGRVPPGRVTLTALAQRPEAPLQRRWELQRVLGRRAEMRPEMPSPDEVGKLRGYKGQQTRIQEFLRRPSIQLVNQVGGGFLHNGPLSSQPVNNTPDVLSDPKYRKPVVETPKPSVLRAGVPGKTFAPFSTPKPPLLGRVAPVLMPAGVAYQAAQSYKTPTEEYARRQQDTAGQSFLRDVGIRAKGVSRDALNAVVPVDELARRYKTRGRYDVERAPKRVTLGVLG